MRRIDPENLSVRQIHHLLLEKRRAVRQSRLVHFHRTGRVMSVFGEIIGADEENETSRSIQNNRAVKRPRTWWTVRSSATRMIGTGEPQKQAEFAAHILYQIFKIIL
jgi:hypothetical protein